MSRGTPLLHGKEIVLASQHDLSGMIVLLEPGYVFTPAKINTCEIHKSPKATVNCSHEQTFSVKPNTTWWISLSHRAPMLSKKPIKSTSVSNGITVSDTSKGNQKQYFEVFLLKPFPAVGKIVHPISTVSSNKWTTNTTVSLSSYDSRLNIGCLTRHIYVAVVTVLLWCGGCSND